MKYRWILLLSLSTVIVTGQNLVPNPGFEGHSSCPQGSGAISNAIPWMNPNLKSPDLYHSCAGSTCVDPPFACVPDNWVGSQYPFSGDAYAGILVGAGNENREYIQVQLLSALTPGQDYTLTYHLSLADDYQHAIDRLGVYFSTTAISTDGQFDLSPQLISAPGLFLTNKGGWMEIRDTLTAAGGEVFITIGNFNREEQTNFVAGQGGTRASSYYYIDEVTLIPTPADEESETPEDPSNPPVPEEEGSTETDPSAEEADCTFYIPNAFSPNGDGINDTFQVLGDCLPDPYELRIFNRWGIEVFETKNTAESWDGRFRTGPAPTGVYLYQLRYADGKEASGAITLLR